MLMDDILSVPRTSIFRRDGCKIWGSMETMTTCLLLLKMLPLDSKKYALSSGNIFRRIRYVDFVSIDPQILQ